jgi:hypothetical protein
MTRISAGIFNLYLYIANADDRTNRDDKDNKEGMRKKPL